MPARDLREYNKKYYSGHSEARKKQIQARQREIKRVVQNIKLESGCKYCGYKKSAMALHFHHTRDKEYTLARMTAQGRSLTSILKEIEKCECVCANCHHELHEKALFV